MPIAPPKRDGKSTSDSRRTPGPGEWLLPVLSAILLVLAQPPFHVLAGAFAGLAPLLVWVAGLPAGAAGRAAALRGGYIFGAVYYGLLLYWIGIALASRIGPVAIPVSLLLLLILASFGAIFTTTLHFTARRGLLPLALTAAVCWTAVEWLQGHLGPAAFPWLGLGGTLAAFPRLAGVADLVGVRGLGFWLALINGLVATVVLRHRRDRPVLPILAATLVAVLIPAGYGFWRASSLDLVPVARVALVQTDAEEIPEPDARRSERRGAALEARVIDLIELAGAVPPGDADLVIWPEVAVPVPLDHPAHADVVGRIADLATRLRTPILVGAYGGSADATRLTNSAFLIRPRISPKPSTPSAEFAQPAESASARGSREVYHKRRLVPFVERGLVPWRLEPGLLPGDRRYFGQLKPGTVARLLQHQVSGARRADAGGAPAAAASFGVLICFESIFPELSRDYRRAGVDYLVNISSDAWFGSGQWYGRTTGLWQHPAHLVFRAIETRSGVVRSANSGFSFAVDPVGRIGSRTGLFGSSIHTVTVQSTVGGTVYRRRGDVLGPGSALTVVLLLLVGWRRRCGRYGQGILKQRGNNGA